MMDMHTPEQQVFKLTFRTGATYSNVLKVNVVGVFLTTKAFVPLLRKKQSRTIVQLSSIFASTSFNRKGTENNPAATKLIAYNSSKAAVNMRKLANLGYSEPLCRIADVHVAAGFRADLCMHLIATMTCCRICYCMLCHCCHAVIHCNTDGLRSSHRASIAHILSPRHCH